MVTLAAEGLCVSFGRRAVLHDVNCSFEAGTLNGVIGPNGAGKSTLLRALSHVAPPSRGRVLVDGEPFDRMTDGRRARTIAYLPQGQSVHWPISVERLVALGRLPHLTPFSRLAEADHEAVSRAMAAADVAHLSGRTATTLSGGELSRVLLARALSVEAPVLIVDEPLAALDPAHQLHTMALLESLARAGRLIVVVMHDLTLASRFCERLLLLSNGCVAAEGRPEAVLDERLVRDVYGVEALAGHHDGQRYILPWKEAR